MGRAQLQPAGGEGVLVSPEAFVMIALIVGAIHVAIACGILAWTAARLNAIVGRAPQLAPLPAADTLRDFTRPIRSDPL